MPKNMTPRLRDGDLIPDLALGSDDPDDFEYEAIAGPVADLVCSGRTPISVALFGPWGSGKSSIGELVRRELEARTPAVAFVHYDAWRYGGSSLKRNFIAHAARELKLTDDARDQEFHRGLFENRKAVELHPGRLGIAFRSALRGVPVVLLLSLTFCSVISGLVLLADLLIDIDASALLGQILVPGGIAVAGSLALIKAFVDVGRIEIDQSKPSEDDQFTATFARLISRVTSAQDDSSGSGAKGRLAQRGRRLSSWASRQPGPAQFRTWWSGAELPTDPVPERVVFFIDELDRCREDDVVATLNAIRTFLEAERCAFIVAADRDVIERALDEVDQATPRNPSDPYYTSAGAFLDKIFNHQISLPPMRARRLNTWARSAALRRRDGLWEELASRGSSASTPDLDDVLFHLIPSHVKSPRRVKVLMNAFATNVRIAQARVPSCWPAERSVLARLTALQVEFPNFAADLRTEPRLPRLAVSGQSDELNDASAKLVSKWALAGDGEPSDLINGSGGRTVPDGTTTDSGFTQLQRQQRIQLARYLERTSGLSDTPRSLLFLDSTGAEVGIEDLALGELVEAEATDSPKAVAEAIVGKSTQEKQGVARLLATMVHEVLTPERGNVMTALMHVSNELGPAVQG
ncbi:MAG: P-loop NTPase fold protein, partial [Patulibacter sp.]